MSKKLNMEELITEISDRIMDDLGESIYHMVEEEVYEDDELKEKLTEDQLEELFEEVQELCGARLNAYHLLPTFTKK